MEHEPSSYNKQPPPGRLFDELAPLKMFRQDIDLYGFVQPETRRQAANEELTFVAESLDAPLLTLFELRQTKNGLVDERGRPLADALQSGLEAAEQEVFEDGRKMFHAQRIVHNFNEGKLIEAMMSPGSTTNTIVSVQPFCDEAYLAYGKKFVENLGYQPDRKLAFLQIYKKLSDDTLEVLSVSIDNSDLDAFRWMLLDVGVEVPAGISSYDFLAYRAHLDLSNSEQQTLQDRLIRRYDSAMKSMYGQEFKAGRPLAEEVEAWGFIQQQPDLVDYYLDRLEQQARIDPGDIRGKRKLTLGFWAALKDRLKIYSPNQISTRSYSSPQNLEQEMHIALRGAIERHEYMVGCGGKVSQDEDLLSLSPEQAFASIFGDKKEILVWKSGFCRIENCPTQPGKTEVAQCNVCRKCQKLYDSGIDPAKVYRIAARNGTGSDKESQYFANMVDAAFRDMGVDSFEQAQADSTEKQTV